MIWIRKKEEVRISALLALFSFPISFIFYGMLVHGEPIFKVLYIPALIVMGLLEYLIGPFKVPQHWLLEIVEILAPITAQYLGYFLFIYLLLKILRKLGITGDKNIAKEQSEKNNPGP